MEREIINSYLKCIGYYCQIAKEKQVAKENKIIVVWVLHVLAIEDLIEKSGIWEKTWKEYYYAVASSEDL